MTVSSNNSDQPVSITAELLLQAEAVLFVAPEPLSYAALASALELADVAVPALLSALRQHFDGRGIRMQELAGRLQLISAPQAGPVVERFLGAHRATRLSNAALEVLAIIAYRQPLTRAEIETVRGVDSSGVLRTLLAHDLVEEAGRAETLGRPILYCTTAQFLHLFGLESLHDLPPMEGIDQE